MISSKGLTLAQLLNTVKHPSYTDIRKYAEQQGLGWELYIPFSIEIFLLGRRRNSG